MSSDVDTFTHTCEYVSRILNIDSLTNIHVPSLGQEPNAMKRLEESRECKKEQ